MAAMSAESRMKKPAEAPREPVGDTYTTTGTGEERMCWMMSCMEVSSPPGVSMVISTRLACSCAACSIPLSMYSAMIGSTSSPMRSSITRAAGPAAAAPLRRPRTRDSP